MIYEKQLLLNCYLFCYYARWLPSIEFGVISGILFPVPDIELTIVHIPVIIK